MTIPPFSNFLKKADIVADWIPFVSTVTNMVDLIGKGIIGLSSAPPKDLSNRYVEHLKEKSVTRCLTLMVPVIGNLTVKIYDSVHQQNQWIALVKAAHEADLQTIQALIKKKANLNARDGEGNTPLMIAAARGDTQVIEALLAAQADVHLTNHAQQSALMLAATNGHLESVKQLKVKTDPTLKDHEGNTALLLAAKNNHVQIVQALSPSCVNDCNDQEETPLMWLARWGNAEALTTLIEAGADPTLHEHGGESALTWAIRAGQEATVRVLIDSGVDVNELSNHNLPLLIARQIGNKAIEEMLQTAGARGLEGILAQGRREIQLDNGVKLKNNRVVITVPRVGENSALGKAQLRAFARLLFCYRNGFGGQFDALGLNVRYENEAAIDVGGPSREFMSQLLKNLVLKESPFPFFEKTDSGQYEIFDKNNVMRSEDLQICQYVGTVLAAAFSGFPVDNPIKIGPFFTQKFYNQLLSMHEYLKSDPLAKTAPFTDLPINKQKKLALFVLERDVENDSDRIMHRLLQQTEWSDTDLNQIGQFLVMDLINGSENRLSPPLSELIQNLAEQPDGLNMLQTDVYQALREALANPEEKKKIEEVFSDSVLETYKSKLSPMLAVAQGFESVNKPRLKSVMRLQATPAEAVNAVSNQIQGPPFTREAFVALLKRSEGSNKAVRERVKWLAQWCENGIGGIKATEKQMKKILRCVTGSEVITDALIFKFETPVNGWSQFHTCFNSVNLGKNLLKQNKKKFIEMWMQQVDAALESAFGIA